jgi:hypothetical protein
MPSRREGAEPDDAATRPQKWRGRGLWGTVAGENGAAAHLAKMASSNVKPRGGSELDHAAPRRQKGRGAVMQGEVDHRRKGERSAGKRCFRVRQFLFVLSATDRLR